MKIDIPSAIVVSIAREFTSRTTKRLRRSAIGEASASAVGLGRIFLNHGYEFYTIGTEFVGNFEHHIETTFAFVIASFALRGVEGLEGTNTRIEGHDRPFLEFRTILNDPE